MSEFKAGDKVWVLCEVAVVYNHESLYVDIRHDGAVFEAKASECRPVEPSNSPKILDSSSDPLAPSPCMDGVNVDQFIEGIMEARGRASDFQVGDAVRFVWPGHKWHRTEGTIISTMGDPSIFVDIKEYPYRFKSDCGAFERWCSADQLERIDKADPVNPLHYKQGGIECIEAIKAATGEGFIGYVWGNVLKYLWRWPKKGGVDDLKKARWYLDRLIQEVGE